MARMDLHRGGVLMAGAVMAALLCGPSYLSAESSKQDSNFFERGFADTGGVKSQDDFFKAGDLAMPRPQPWQGEKSGRPRPVPRPAAERAAVGVRPPEPQESKPAAMKNTAPVDGPKVRSVGLVVNGLDIKHFDRVLTELLALKKERGIPIGVVHIMGLNVAYKSKLVLPLFAAGGKILNERSVPAEYRVKRSPAWILDTAQGTVLLEGVKAARYINTRGEFIDSSSALAEASGAEFPSPGGYEF